MAKVYEFTTWRGGEEWEEKNRIAIAAAKKHEGRKFVVAVGEWGVRSFLVLADSKEEARAAVDANGTVKVRDVTGCKKYQPDNI